MHTSLYWILAILAILALLAGGVFYFVANPFRVLFMSVNPSLSRDQVRQSTQAVELNKYTGVWYTVATLRATSFQLACRQKTQVEYQSQPGGSGLIVKNACETFVFGEVVQEVAAVSRSQNNRILLVGAYSGNTEGNYVIYDFSPEVVPARNSLGDSEFSISGYKWVLVGDADLNEAWLMVRDPSQGRSIMKETQALLTQLDIYDKLLLEPQTEADYLLDENIERTRNTTVKEFLQNS